jgi:hypothetical protein
MNPDRVHFGARLRQQRESRSLSIPDIVKITKIPEKSVVHLEEGAFEDLPADVFVRGFLKSYCKAVGLDVEATLAEYHELTRGAAPKSPPSLAKLASSEKASAISRPLAPVAPGSAATTAAPREPTGEHAAVPVELGAPPAPAPPSPPVEEPSIFASLATAGRSTSRASLTIAVVILVIVATLTLSLLLRRPGHVGDRVSGAPHAPAALT